MFKISDISVDYHSLMKSENYIFVTDSSKPVISYQVISDRRDSSLRSACIEVNQWKTNTDEQCGIVYDGEALQPFSTYEITVTAEDDQGNTARKKAFFQTAKLGSPWEAKWITDTSLETEPEKSPRPLEYLRKFTVTKPVKNAYIVASAMGIFDLYLDGKRICEDYFAPGFTDYDYHLQYQYYPLELSEGEHELRAIVASGWACGRTTNVSNTNQSVSMLSAKTPAFLGELTIHYMDHTKETILTGPDFLVAESANYLFADFYDGEIYDRRQDITRWKSAEIAELTVHPKLICCYGERINAHERLEPKSYTKTENGTYIFDFGQNFAGVVEFFVRSHSGRMITIRHGETLENGKLYVQNLRSAKQTVQYICKEGVQNYSPRFTYMGFQYAEVEGIDEEMIASGDFVIFGKAIYSDVSLIGTFTCSNGDLNQLQSNIVWSGKSNFVDIPTDCPQRDERQGWTGDIALFAETACFNFDMNRFLGKWLKDMKAEQGALGAIPFVVPIRKGVTPKITTSCWGDSCIMVPYALYNNFGNKTILKEMYPVMKKYLTDVRRWAGLGAIKHGSTNVFALPFQFGDWCAPYGNVKDWLSKGAWTGTAYYSFACRLMAEIAECLGEEKDAKYYRRKSEKIAATYLKKFMNEEGALPKEKEFQTGYVLPLYFGFGEEKLRKKMAQHLWKLICDHGKHLSTGFTATPYILFALADAGLVKEAYELLMQDTNPSWLYQIRKGATTTWEQWAIIKEDGQINEGSMNHYAYGAVGDFFYKRICGLTCIKPGFKEFQVKPMVGGNLSYAKCTHESPYGMIEVSWERDATEEKLYHLQVTVPVGTHCNVVCNQLHKRIGSGTYEFEWTEA